MSDYCINDLINSGQGLTIFWVIFIQVTIVDTHPLFSIFLWYDNNICKPLRVLYFSNRSGFQKPFNFFSYYLLLLLV